MANKKIAIQVVKCQCNVCGQVAFVEPNLRHHHCNAIKLLPGQILPALFRSLSHPDPNKKGRWIAYVAPEVPIESPCIEA